MSRGPGRVQLHLLRTVERAHDELRPELYMSVSATDLGLGEHPESRRRAAHQLADAGLIEILTRAAVVASPSGRFFSEGVRRQQLFARMPYTHADHLHAVELHEEWGAHVESFLDESREPHERSSALAWMQWYEAAENTGFDFGRELAPQLAKQTEPSSAVRRLWQTHR